MSKLKGKEREERFKRLKLREMVKVFDDPALRTVCTAVDPYEDLWFLTKMKQVCNAFDTGAGLAAPQIGVFKKAIYIKPPNKPDYFMLNPVIEYRSPEMVTAEEGCLSYPGIFGPVERHQSIRVQFYQSEDANEKARLASMYRLVVRMFDGMESRIIQHEVDHLLGVCRVGEFWPGRKNRSDNGKSTA